MPEGKHVRRLIGEDKVNIIVFFDEFRLGSSWQCSGRVLEPWKCPEYMLILYERCFKQYLCKGMRIEACIGRTFWYQGEEENIPYTVVHIDAIIQPLYRHIISV